VGKIEGPMQLRSKGPKMELTLTQPDDWHLHLRDGDLLEAVVSHRSFVLHWLIFFG
jgi:dihydroorotase